MYRGLSEKREVRRSDAKERRSHIAGVGSIDRLYLENRDGDGMSEVKERTKDETELDLALDVCS